MKHYLLNKDPVDALYRFSFQHWASNEQNCRLLHSCKAFKDCLYEHHHLLLFVVLGEDAEVQLPHRNVQRHHHGRDGQRDVGT